PCMPHFVYVRLRLRVHAPVRSSSLRAFFLYRDGDPRVLHSFPTRRSSDLPWARGLRCGPRMASRGVVGETRMRGSSAWDTLRSAEDGIPNPSRCLVRRPTEILRTQPPRVHEPRHPPN